MPKESVVPDVELSDAEHEAEEGEADFDHTDKASAGTEASADSPTPG
jgi:hypothetical protein